MLWQRVVTALVLLPLILAAIFLLPNVWFGVAMIVPVYLAGREWANLSCGCRTTFLSLLLLMMLALVPVLYTQREAGLPLLWIAAAFWLWALYLVVRYPAVKAWHKQRFTMTLTGLVLLVPAWYAVVFLQGVTFDLNGPQPGGEWRGLLLLGAFVIVWGADVGAYFAGRAFGRRKLAVHVSPGKSVEGAFGGLALTLALGAGLAAWLALSAEATLQLLALVLVTTLASILGDLFESMVKRESGVKDSGNLLPGHGGMLDRIDSVTCALPVFALGWTFVNLA